jgi:hypothetical protein
MGLSQNYNAAVIGSFLLLAGYAAPAANLVDLFDTTRFATGGWAPRAFNVSALVPARAALNVSTGLALPRAVTSVDQAQFVLLGWTGAGLGTPLTVTFNPNTMQWSTTAASIPVSNNWPNNAVVVTSGNPHSVLVLATVR